MTTLVEFLTARLDERQSAAEAMPPFPWSVSEDDDSEVMAADGVLVASAFALSSNQLRNTAAWIAANGPDVVLADMAAKRRVIAYISQVQADAGEPPHFDPDDAAALTHILRLLALPFADHPDYQQGWAL